MTAQKLRHAYYKILLKILLKEFIKLIANRDIMIKNTKLLDLNTKLTNDVLNKKKYCC